MAVLVQPISEIPNLELGEGPHWDSESAALYFVDIFGKSIHKYLPNSGQHTKAKFDKHVSLIVPVKGKLDQFVIGLERELCIITWDGLTEKVSKIEKLVEVDQETENRINDGKCDPIGRLWFGTMGPEPEYGHVKPLCGSLFSIKSGKISTHLTQVGVSNGLAWNKELNQFYYVDTPKKTVDAFDFDIDTGTISNRRVILTLNKHDIDGFPDGMTIDIDGNLWLAVFNGYRVVKFDPRRPETVLQTVNIPAKQVTSVVWGGKDLDILYVTSASFTIDGVKLLPPNHGATFQVTGLGTKGLPGDNYVIE